MRKLNLMFLLPALAILSCSKDSENELEETEQQVITKELTANVEEAFPGELGKVSDVYFAGQKMPMEAINGDFVYQGDMLFRSEMVTSQPVDFEYEKGKEVQQQKSVGRTSGRWPDNKVYYSIDGSLSDKKRVYDAISHWESNTSLDFVERSGQSNYIYFTTGSGCSSYVGMVGGRQNISLASACSTGNTIHEIGHAVGLWHEQSRVDRNNHIKINWNNIKSGKEHNFETYAENGSDGDEFTSNLDFGSIMMYGPYSFSSNGEPTIVKANGSLYSVQRSALSSGDEQGIQSMYPDAGTAPSYINGEYYTIAGLTVLRYNNTWYFRTKYGFKRVELINERWYWV